MLNMFSAVMGSINCTLGWFSYVLKVGLLGFDVFFLLFLGLEVCWVWRAISQHMQKV